MKSMDITEVVARHAEERAARIAFLQQRRRLLLAKLEAQTALNQHETDIALQDIDAELDRFDREQQA